MIGLGIGCRDIDPVLEVMTKINSASHGYTGSSLLEKVFKLIIVNTQIPTLVQNGTIFLTVFMLFRL